MPLFFHPFYIGPEATPWDRAFGWSSGILFIVFIPPIFASMFVAHGILYVLLYLGSMQLEAAFDKLDPKLAQLGVHQFVDNKHRL